MPVTVPRRGRRPLVWGTCAVIVLLPVVSWLLGGPDAAAGAAIGPALVAAFFAGGWVPVAVGTRVPALLAFILLGLGYALRIVLLLVVLTALRDARWVDGRVLGGTVVFAALVWGFVQIGVHVTSRRPTIEPMG